MPAAGLARVGAGLTQCRGALQHWARPPTRAFGLEAGVTFDSSFRVDAWNGLPL